jgi:hypothetical protein
MKRYIIILPIVVLACVGMIWGAATVLRPGSTSADSAIASPWVTESVKPDGGGGISVYSPKIRIEGIAPGGVADEINGEPITLNIENTYIETITVSVFYTAPSENTTDIDTGFIYSPAPEKVREWVTIATVGEIIIPAQSTIHIPVKLAIPKGIKELPERWEFNIKVSEGGGFVTRGYIQRYLITMR